MVEKLMKETRTFRRFQQDKRISLGLLEKLIDLTRLAGSARNGQPWQYIALCDQESCNIVFPHLGWAGYLTDWSGPVEGEKPAAYILCILEKSWLKGSEKEAYFDLGVATQNVLLGAMQHGIGGCRIASISNKLSQRLQLSDTQSLELVIALGYPAEKVVLTEGLVHQDVKYWRDENGTHHVPKRTLADILLTKTL